MRRLRPIRSRRPESSLRRWLPWALAGACALFAGCGTVPTVGDDSNVVNGPPTVQAAEPAMTVVAPTGALDPELLRPAALPYRLGPGDVIGIDLIGDSSGLAAEYPPSGVARATVGPDGKIYYFTLPGIDVWGLTLQQASDRIADAMSRFVRERPLVSVSLETAASEQVWILGQVAHPGVYTLDGPTSLLDLLAQAGGLSSGSPLASLASTLGLAGSAGGADNADLAHAFLVRRGQVLPVDFDRLLRDGDISQNLYLEPGDFIYIPSTSSAQVHVLGAVATPRAERMSGRFTLVQAVAMAGGTAPGAYLQDVAIMRGPVSRPQLGVVNLGAILHGRAPDVALEPGDIVYVPVAPYHTLERYALLILNTFGNTMGVNEGTRLISSRATAIGVSVSVPQ